MGKTIPLRPKVKPIYKYRINELIRELPKRISITQIIEHLKGEGIARLQFYRDRNIKAGDNWSIPSDRLLKYCQVFECTVKDLTTTMPKAKPIRDALPLKQVLK